MANATVAKLTAVLQMNNTKFKKGLTNSQKALNAFKSQIKAVGGMVAGAFTVGALISFGQEAVKVAAQAEGIGKAFKDLNRADLLDELKAATRGTVSELSLMQAAVRADNFKVPLEQLGTFFQFATQRAIQTGESVDYLVESIINGIGRKSTLVMDNLGISAAELQEEIKKVGDFGQAAANIIAREMGKAGEVMDTTATRMAQLRARFEDTKKTVGEGLIKAVVAASDAWNMRFNPSVFAANEGMRVAVGMIEYVTDALDGLDEAMAIGGAGGFFTAQENVKNLREEYEKLMATVKSPDAFNLPEGFEEAWSGSGVLQGMAWTRDPDINQGLTVVQEVMASLDAFANEGLDAIDKFGGAIPEKVLTPLEGVSKMIGQNLIMQFDQLGYAIGQFASGAEGAFSSLGQTILANLGNILIMMAAQMGPAGIPLLIAGIGLQLGGGLLRGLGSSANAGGSGSTGADTVKFEISGKNLVGTLERNTDYTNRFT